MAQVRAVVDSYIHFCIEINDDADDDDHDDGDDDNFEYLYENNLIQGWARDLWQILNPHYLLSAQIAGHLN